MIYLDNASTSFPKPESVYLAMDRFGRTGAFNPGRGGYRGAIEAERLLSETRQLLARLFGARHPERIVFTCSATDALNMAVKGLLRPGDHVVTSVLEHNSVSRPLNRLARDGVIRLTRLPVSGDYVIDPKAVIESMQPSTKLVAICHVSNVVGTIQPIDAIGAAVRERGSLFLVDAAQSAGIVPINVERGCVDLLAFAGHKGLMGPAGIGGLFVGERATLGPWREGGTGGDSASTLQPKDFPHTLEAGTPNVVGVAGLREGIRYVLNRGVNNVLTHERNLVEQFVSSMDDPSRLRWYPDARSLSGEGRIGLFGLNIPGMDSAEVVTIVDQRFGIAARAGLHCAPYVHQCMGTFPCGTVRISVGALSTEEDVRLAAHAFEEVANT